VGASALAVAGFFVAAACEPAPSSSGGGCSRDAAIALAPGEVRIERVGDASTARPSPPSEHFDARSGALVRRGLTLEQHIAVAWGLRPGDLDVAAALESGAFDVCARAPSGDLEDAQALVRGALEQHLGIDVASGRRTGPVLALRVHARGLAPSPGDPNVARADDDADVRRPGLYRVRNAEIADLVAFLAQRSPIPIVDETGLGGRYDLSIEWDTATGARGLREALADAGFELARARATTQRWVARAAR